MAEDIDLNDFIKTKRNRFGEKLPEQDEDNENENE